MNTERSNNFCPCYTKQNQSTLDTGQHTWPEEEAASGI